ncbi:hypothetical protein HPB47_012285, partial [Ixodes persulcatus]
RASCLLNRNWEDTFGNILDKGNAAGLHQNYGAADDWHRELFKERLLSEAMKLSTLKQQGGQQSDNITISNKSRQASLPGAEIEEMAGIADAQSIEMATLRKRTHLAAELDEFLSETAITGDCCGGKERPKVMNSVESVVKCFNDTEHPAGGPIRPDPRTDRTGHVGHSHGGDPEKRPRLTRCRASADGHAGVHGGEASGPDSWSARLAGPPRRDRNIVNGPDAYTYYGTSSSVENTRKSVFRAELHRGHFVFDSSAKPHSGVLEGGLTFLGLYSECLEALPEGATAPNLSVAQQFHSRYCLATLNLHDAQEEAPEGFPEYLWQELRANPWPPQFGLCVPSSCSPEDVTSMVGQWAYVLVRTARPAHVSQMDSARGPE